MTPRTITFLSDYGDADGFAGVCRAVIARIAPEARADRPHATGSRRHDVRQGAAVLANSLAVRSRRASTSPWSTRVSAAHAAAVAVRNQRRGAAFVGPDNGLLSPAIEHFGGAVEAVEISRSPPGSSRSRRPSTAATSSRRSRRIWRSASRSASLGEAIDPGSLRSSSCGEPEVEPGVRLAAEVGHVDGFGNATPRGATSRRRRARGPARRSARRVSAPRAVLGSVLRPHLRRRRGRQLLLYAGASGSLALAINRGSAADVLDADSGRARRADGDVSDVRPRPTCTCGGPARPTIAPASSQKPARRAGPSSPPTSRAPGAGAEAGRGRRRPERRCCTRRSCGRSSSSSALLPLAVAACRLRGDRVGQLAAPCAIKWPNDVWIDERKVAGVLIEARPPEWAVIGVGVNVAIADEDFPDDLRWPATSVGGGVTVGAVRDALVRRSLAGPRPSRAHAV